MAVVRGRFGTAREVIHVALVVFVEEEAFETLFLQNRLVLACPDRLLGRTQSRARVG